VGFFGFFWVGFLGGFFNANPEQGKGEKLKGEGEGNRREKRRGKKKETGERR
jgi:hypothetical protein